MKVAVIGLGQFGRALVEELHRNRVEVIAVDAEPELVEDVKHSAAMAVRMDAQDEKELRAQGIHTVDVAVVAIGDDFETDLLVTVLLKKHGVRRVIARAGAPLHETILRNVGADEVIWPEQEAAIRLAQRLAVPSVKNFFELAEGCSMMEVDAPPAFEGRTLAEVHLRQAHKLNLVAVRRRVADGKAGEGKTREVVRPLMHPDERILAGDVLAVVGMDEDLKAFLERLPSLR